MTSSKRVSVLHLNISWDLVCLVNDKFLEIVIEDFRRFVLFADRQNTDRHVLQGLISISLRTMFKYTHILSE